MACRSQNEETWFSLTDRKINYRMPHNVLQLLLKGLNENGKAVKGAKIVVLGLACKKNIGDTRKTLDFSKKRQGRDDQMTLFYTHFNFCRPHGSLQHEGENGIKRKWTPMRELAITDRNWSLLELLKYPCHNISVY